MAITRTAVQSPPVAVSTVFYKRSDAYASSAGTAPSAEHFSFGEHPLQKLNENALLTDLSTLYTSGPIWCICKGLTLSPASGGSISVSAGHANIDGIVELSADATGIGVVPGWNYAYLVRSASGGTGTVQTVSASIVAPANAAFLGAVNVSSGAGAADFSGVVYDNNMGRIRTTADAGTPADTPPAGVMFWTKTVNGLYLWTGTAYVRMDPVTVTAETPSGTINSSNTAFTLANAPSPANSLRVYVGASATTLARLAPSAYSLTGAALTFTTAPATGSVIVVDYRY